MKRCSRCNKIMEEKKGSTPEGITYNYFRCKECNEEIVDMRQLHDVAQKYRVLKKYSVKLSKWGMSLGLRIPKELVEDYGLTEEKEVSIIPEENGILIVPA